LLGAGPHRIFVSLDFSPNRRGGVAVTPSADPGRNLRIKEFFDVVRVVWGPPMFTELQLWVLGTIVMLGVVIVSVKLPG